MKFSIFFYKSLKSEILIPKLKDGSWRADYYKYWAHADQKVLVSVTGEKLSGTVKEVDMDGVLRVSLDSGEIRSFDTDNNSFDLMSGLISQK